MIKKIIPALLISAVSTISSYGMDILKASWKGSFSAKSMDFTNISGQSKWVKSLGFEARNLHFKQTDDVTFISLPTVNDYTLLIRHSKNPQDLQSVTEGDIASMIGVGEQYVRYFNAPFVSMNQTLNSKTLLKDQLPQILQESFQTVLDSNPVGIANYTQNVTFDMNDKGFEASSVTAMMCEQQCGREILDGPIININSPFTFALTKTMNSVDYLLFQGQVIDHDVMEIMS